MRKNIKLKCEETLKDFKCLLNRYNEVKSNPELFKMFMSRNRNPIWDISQTTDFRTGLSSKNYKEQKKNNQRGAKYADDHFIQRTKAMKTIFYELSNNPEMSTDDFILLLKKYSSTIRLTKEEHNLVSNLSKNRDVFNYQVYSELGIEVEGLENFLIEHNIPY
jgi:hypothetical protein